MFGFFPVSSSCRLFSSFFWAKVRGVKWSRNGYDFQRQRTEQQGVQLSTMVPEGKKYIYKKSRGETREIRGVSLFFCSSNAQLHGCKVTFRRSWLHWKRYLFIFLFCSFFLFYFFEDFERTLDEYNALVPFFFFFLSFFSQLLWCLYIQVIAQIFTSIYNLWKMNYQCQLLFPNFSCVWKKKSCVKKKLRPKLLNFAELKISNLKKNVQSF